MRSKKEIKSSEKTDEDEENALKENYFKKFYDERKHLGLIGFSSGTINFERSETNDSRLVKSLNYTGFNLGYRFYIRGKISLSFSYDGLSLGSVDYYDEDEANEDDEQINFALRIFTQKKFGYCVSLVFHKMRFVYRWRYCKLFCQRRLPV